MELQNLKGSPCVWSTDGPGGSVHGLQGIQPSFDVTPTVSDGAVSATTEDDRVDAGLVQRQRRKLMV